MKHLALLLCLPLALAGCAATPTAGTATTQPSVTPPAASSAALQRLSLAEQSYRVALDAVHGAVVLGLLKGSDLKPWLPVERAAGAALDAAEAVAATGGDPTTLGAAVGEAEAALPKLAPLLNYVSRAKAALPPAPAAKK